MKVENHLSLTPTDLASAGNISSQPGATESRNRNSPFEAEPAPFNFIGALPRDILHEILKKLDGPSQTALSFTDKATLELHGNILSRKYDGLINDIFKVKPNKRHQDVFYAIHAELQRHKIIDLTPADKVMICRFFEQNVFAATAKEHGTLCQSAAQTGSAIVARHMIASVERHFFSEASHVKAQQSLDDFTATFSRHGLADSRSIVEFLKSARTLPHPEAFTAKLYRAVQRISDRRPAQALTNFLATLGHWFSRTSPEEFIGTVSSRELLHDLKIVRDMLRAATPVAAQLGSHSLSEHLSGTEYTGENALIAIQRQIEAAIGRVEAYRPPSLKERTSSALKSRFK
ncbi:hypothetical protein MW7_001995 [Imbroritus primus]|uniref:Uncharacterized protein n=1 Tax=Imbroritus primus TaxID=3058603 RepID=A0ACD3SSX6_9BURK|nr:hypothetical protein MW7_001995 [Burkholderiaceae bacterium PBA]